MYLVFTLTNGIKEAETMEEVKCILEVETFIWTQSNCYSGDLSWEELFRDCLFSKNFGDIAQVYEIKTYFLAGKGKKTKISCGFYEADFNKSFDCMKIM